MRVGTARASHVRHRRYARLRRQDSIPSFLAAQATDLDATGAAFDFTVLNNGAAIPAVGVLTLAANAANTETVTIGSRVYTFKTALTEVKALGTLTGTTIAATNTVTIGGVVYTFVAVLSVAPAVPYEVLVGISDEASLDNLIAAINLAAGEGTTYGTGTLVHPSVSAAAGAGDTAVITAKVPGVAGNAITTTATLTAGGFGAATLASGVDPVAGEVVVGGSASASLDNLIAAINAAAGVGTTYSTGTLEHADVDAAAGTGDTMDLEAVVAGRAGNAIATTETMAQGSFGAVTLTTGQESGGLTAVAHGLASGAGPYFASSTTTLPAGLVAERPYWLEVVDADTVFLCTRRGDVGRNRVATVGDDGTGTHTLTRASTPRAIFEILKQRRARTVAAATDVDSL